MYIKRVHFSVGVRVPFPSSEPKHAFKRTAGGGNTPQQLAVSAVKNGRSLLTKPPPLTEASREPHSGGLEGVLSGRRWPNQSSFLNNAKVNEKAKRPLRPFSATDHGAPPFVFCGGDDRPQRVTVFVYLCSREGVICLTCLRLYENVWRQALHVLRRAADESRGKWIAAQPPGKRLPGARARPPRFCRWISSRR